METYPDQGTAHTRLGDAHPAHNSNPPTSGWHTPQTVPWGVHRTAIPDEVLVHNLEHGGIWISYKDPTDTVLVEKLKALASRYRRCPTDPAVGRVLRRAHAFRNTPVVGGRAGGGALHAALRRSPRML